MTIESGSLTPGVRAADFGLPADAAMRFELPARALRQHLTNYVVLDAEHPLGHRTRDWMLPGAAQIWLLLSAHPMRVQLGNRSYDPMPEAALYGVTSYAMPIESQGGVTVGIRITPRGWARLFRVSAESLRDRVTPLHEVMPAALVDTLVARLRASDQARDVKPILDDFFAAALATPHADEPRIAAIGDILAESVDEQVHDIDTAALARGISPAAVRRLTKAYFGFPPKTLQLRSRFLQSLGRMLVRRRAGVDYSEMAASYHDPSHFNRDARRFLGMTGRQFLAIDMPYLNAALRARGLVMAADAAHGREDDV